MWRLSLKILFQDSLLSIFQINIPTESKRARRNCRALLVEFEENLS